MPGEVQCPKGWGQVGFKGSEEEMCSCPISDAECCKDCKVGAKNSDWQSDWKKLKQGKTE